MCPPVALAAEDVEAGVPRDLAVTIYRSPAGGPETALDLDELAGFALITETRTLSLQPGESRLRFPGVAEGIEAASALLAGLPGTVLEKNRDARVLSPEALVAATLGRKVTLVRTDRKTGRTTRTEGTLRAASDGVLFESAAGVEALRCSGMPETFELEQITSLSATPTLSVWARTARPVTAPVTLSYLARGFDWTATYSATLAPDARTMSLGAWVTLANSNGVSFAESRVAVVAGRVKHEADWSGPRDTYGPIVARCWPLGSTSRMPRLRPLPRDVTQTSPLTVVLDAAVLDNRSRLHAEEEQLGDLKLYRVPERTTLNAFQMKQVRLLDREGVLVELLHVADVEPDQEMEPAAARRVLRTRNDIRHHLGLALPAGTVDVFVQRGEVPLLLAQSPLSDTAVGQDFEIGAGAAPDVQIESVRERRSIGPAVELPLLPGVRHLRRAVRDGVMRIDISNAGSEAISFEARLRPGGGTQLIGAEPIPVLENGRQVLRIDVPGGSRAAIRYRTEHLVQQAVRPR
jgi:hypothetical protein